MRSATGLRCVAELASNDPLIVSALAYLPSIAELSVPCMWPASFATFMERRHPRTGAYRYLASHEVRGHSCIVDLHEPEAVFELSNRAPQYPTGLPVQLLPRSHLFAAHQRSLSAEQQAVLARWAANDFHVDDGQLSAAEQASVESEEDEKADADCGESALQRSTMYMRYQPAESAQDEERKE